MYQCNYPETALQKLEEAKSKLILCFGKENVFTTRIIIEYHRN